MSRIENTSFASRWPAANPDGPSCSALGRLDSRFEVSLDSQSSREWAELRRERNPEFLSRELLSFAKRLEDRKKLEGAAALYEVVLTSPFPQADVSLARQRLDALRGRGALGARMESAVTGIAEAACDYRLIVPSLAASAAFQFGKFALLSRLGGGPNWLNRVAAGALAVPLEASVFSLTARALSPEPSRISFGEATALAAFNLGFFKFAGLASRQSLASRGLAEAGILLGLFATARLSASLHPESAGGNDLLDAIHGYLGMKIGGHVAGRLFGNFQFESRTRIAEEPKYKRFQSAMFGLEQWAPTGVPMAHLENFAKAEMLRPGPLSLMTSGGGDRVTPTEIIARRPNPLVSKGRFPILPPPKLAERLREFFRLRSAFPVDNNSAAIIDAALETEGGQGNFNRRLLEAYAASPYRGSLHQVYTAFAVKDLFKGNALRSSLGSFDQALLQGAFRLVLAEDESEKRIPALLGLFDLMDTGLTRGALVGFMREFDPASECRIREAPRYSRAFWNRHAMEISKKWNRFSERDAILLTNLVFDFSGEIAEKASEAIDTIGRHSELYNEVTLAQAFHYARNHPYGQMVAHRIFHILVIGDIPAKLEEIIDDVEKPDSLAVIRSLADSGNDIDDIAHAINGSHHTAYLDDLRLARKIASAALEAEPYLMEPNLERGHNVLAMEDLYWSKVEAKTAAREPWYPDDFLAMLEKAPNRQVEILKKALAAGQIRFRLETDAYEAELSRRPALPKSTYMFISHAVRPGETSTIWVRNLAVPNPAERDRSHFIEFRNRMQGLLHETGHFLQANGMDESIAPYPDSQRFSFRKINRQDRLATELMSVMDEDVWRVRYATIEPWVISRRLGQNLAIYYRNAHDYNYYESQNLRQLARLKGD